MVFVFLMVLALNVWVAKSVMDEAVLELKGAVTTIRLVSFCKDKIHLLIASTLPQNSNQGSGFHNTL